MIYRAEHYWNFVLLLKKCMYISLCNALHRTLSSFQTVIQMSRPVRFGMPRNGNHERSFFLGPIATYDWWKTTDGNVLVLIKKQGLPIDNRCRWECPINLINNFRSSSGKGCCVGGNRLILTYFYHVYYSDVGAGISNLKLFGRIFFSHSVYPLLGEGGAG